VLRGHTAPVYGIAFDPHGRRLASCSFDRTVKIWELGAGQEVLSLTHSGPVYSVAFGSDGQAVASGCDNGDLRLWLAPSASESEEVRPESLDIVQGLFGNPKRPLPRDVAIAQIRSNRSISETVRRQALSLAEHYPEEPLQLNNAAWDILVPNDSTPEDYQLALRQAEAACRLVREDGNFLNTLGIAQYRAGKFQDALRTLEEADRLTSTRNGASSPLNTAFIAMAHFQLAHQQKALEALQLLRQQTKKPQWAKSDEARLFSQEAEKLIGGGASR
jgi:hypothetical protein